MYEWAANKMKLERAVRAMQEVGSNDETSIKAYYSMLGGLIIGLQEPIDAVTVESNETLTTATKPVKKPGRPKKNVIKAD